MLDSNPIECGLEDAFDSFAEPIVLTGWSPNPTSSAIVFANAAFVDLVGMSANALREKSLRQLFPTDDSIALFAELDGAWQRTINFEGIAPFVTDDRQTRLFQLQTRPVLQRNGSSTLCLHIFRRLDDGQPSQTGGDSVRPPVASPPRNEDLSASAHFARSLRTLHDISTDTERSFEDKVGALLAAGCELLDMPIGIVSHVTGRRYEIFQAVSPDDSITAGQVFDLGETYCQETLKARRPIGFERASGSSWARHPCYRAHRLEAYLGVPIIENETVFGTLNFSGPEPRETPFCATDREILALMAEWIGLELSRQQTLQTLQDRETRIRTITDGLPSRIAYVDREIRYRFVNKAYEVRFGIPPSDIIGKHVRDIQGADVYPALVPLIERALAGETVHFEWVEGEGEAQRFFDVTYIPARGKGGDVLGFHALIHDITKLKSIQRALAESVRRQAAILDNIPDIAWLEDTAGRFIAVNEAFAHARHAKPGDLLGLAEQDIWPDGARAAPTVSPSCPDTHPRRRRYETRTTDRFGNIAWVDVIKTPILDGNGMPIGATGIARDITERKAAEAELFREKERAQVTLHSIADAVITTDAAGRIEYLNPVAEALTGWRSDVARGQPIDAVFRVIDETSQQPAIDPVFRCLESGETTNRTAPTVLLSRGGHRYAIDDTVAPIRQPDGTVLGMVVVFRDVTEKRRVLQQMAHDAAHDPLTGLINRREFERRLDRAVASAKRYDHCHAICYLDLDHFKTVNDTVGHAAGDQMLRQVRGLMAGTFRERDTFARIGGDEFGLLLDNCVLEEAVKICEIIASLFRDFVFSWEGHAFHIGISIGIVPIDPASASVATLLEQADAACYAAKKRGRGRVHVFDHACEALALEPIDMLRPRDLQDAVNQNRLCLFAQPIVPLAESRGHRAHIELLVRCRDSRDQIVLPEAFLPVAERSGLMAAIDRWVISTAFRHFGEQKTAESVDFSINLSDSSLSDASLVAFIKDLQSRYRIAPERVCFEIAETSANAELGNAAAFARTVRSDGFRIAIDNFGSGVSSFACLKALPADYLKISGRCINAMIESPVDQALVAAINDMAHAMRMRTIANHAHSHALLRRLSDLGIDFAQGEAVSAPSPLRPLDASTMAFDPMGRQMS